MMLSSKIKLNALKCHILSLKFPFRLSALAIILLLLSATYVFTYRGLLDLLDFFNKGHFVKTILEHIISLIIALLISAATFIQSASIIWDKMSNWGQTLDNIVLKYTIRKTYFLDEIDDLFRKARKSINIVNKELLDIYKNITFYHLEQSTILFLHLRLKNNIRLELRKADLYCFKVISLLKNNEPFDNINRERKNNADTQLNQFINQISDNFQKIRVLLNFLKD